MKKYFSLTLSILCMVFLFCSCTSNKPGLYKDGVYRVEEESFSKQGWKEFASITVKDGKVQEVTFDAISNKGEIKSKSSAYDKIMQDAGSPTWPSKFYPETAQQYKEVQQVSKMKNITGATNSVTNFIYLVGKLEVQMTEGKEETLVVPNKPS